MRIARSVLNRRQAEQIVPMSAALSTQIITEKSLKMTVLTLGIALQCF